MVRRARVRELAIGVVAYPGAQEAAVLGLVDLFTTADRVHAAAGAAGPRLHARVIRMDGQAPAPASLDALVLPPSLTFGGPREPPPPALLAWLLAQHRAGAQLCSVCAGAFVLAATGLLAGRPATTHWDLREPFTRAFPDVALDTQRLVIDDGDVITAGGVMAWIDLGLALIGRYLGPSTMLATARQWVVDPGGREQRFYDTFAPILGHGDAAILRVQHLLHAARTGHVDLATMARRARLTERTFLRRFRRATGHTPTDYVQLLRVARARELLERSLRSFDDIAWQLGYHDAGAFRRIFQRVMGLAPGEYRRRFGVAVVARPAA
jgi:transcriptional regulator GlxA family with amidase domain